MTTRKDTGRAGSRRRGGFTIIELLAVMGVIAILSVLAVGGYNGILRAFSESSAEDALRRAVMLARQQACVEGTDLYVWPTDVNKFIVIRKVGMIMETDNAARQPSYMKKKVSTFKDADGKTKQVKWILDPFADLEDSSGAITGVDETGDAYDELVESYLQNFSGQYQFDIDGQCLAYYAYPPWFSSDEQCWVFGIPAQAQFASADGDYFAAGHEYGVVVLPEQILPSGFFFKGSEKGDGDFDPNWAKRNNVHVLPDGRVEKQVDFVISEGSEASSGTVEHKVTVRKDGTVSTSSR